MANHMAYRDFHSFPPSKLLCSNEEITWFYDYLIHLSYLSIFLFPFIIIFLQPSPCSKPIFDHRPKRAKAVMQLLKRFPSNGTCDSSAIGGSGVIGFHQWEKGWFMMEYPIWLVVSTPLKNMKVSWDYYSQYMEKSSRPPAINMDDEKNGVPLLDV